ncbi:MAG: hypothetical protein QOC82_632 [Frankiaceae bacterium]|jgi:hypothetical protein|nr:hypothetical protein [Frankiaceae bacterium]
MSGLYDDSRPVRSRPWYAAQLVVLGAGLVAAGLHGPAGRVHAAPLSYRPPAAAIAPAPVSEVHTLSGTRTTPAPRKAPRHTAAPRPSATRPAAAHRAATVARRTAPVASTSFRQALDAAIARIPSYRPGTAQWIVSRAYDFWGTADWYHDVLYVSPDVPMSKLYDVAVHEWSHELSVLDYAGDVARATAAMNAWFGGGGLTGPERAADCMSVLQGARWTHYTTCTNAVWRAGAAKLLAGQRL